MPNDWSFDEPKCRMWLNQRADQIKRLFESTQPSLKVLIFLLLLEQKKPNSYENIHNILMEKGVIQGKISKDSLRVAMSDLSTALDEADHPYSLKSRRGVGRQVEFFLERRPEPVGSQGYETVKTVLVPQPQTITPVDIARNLMVQARLSFWELYYFTRSSCFYVHYTAEEGEQRAPLEGEAFENLGALERILKAAKTDVVGLVCLAIHGEGRGEIEVLRMLLNAGKTVHFLTMDVSKVFLVSQLGIVEVVFAEEIKKKQLLCVGVPGNPLTDGLEIILARARQELHRLELIENIEDFLPAHVPITASYFANCLGNNHLDKEGDIFAASLIAFQGRHIEMLIGVSVQQKDPVTNKPIDEQYPHSWYDFLIQTPYHLKDTLQLLKSPGEKDDEKYPEFRLPPQRIQQGDIEHKTEKHPQENNEDDQIRLTRCPPAKREPYFASHGIQGDIYRFYYKLTFDLEMPTALLRMNKEDQILLYSIIKYDVDSLSNGLMKRGRFRVVTKKDAKTKLGDVKTREKHVRRYEVFVAYVDA